MKAWMEQAARVLAGCTEIAIVQADDSFAGLDEYVRLRQMEHVAVFTGRHAADASGAWSVLLEALHCTGCAVNRFREIPPEPDTDTVMAMVDFLAARRPDGVIALGGGSVLDAAKAAYMVWQSGIALENCFGSNRISEAFPARRLERIIAIPTTSGTGSEATQYANIVNRKLGVKQLISDSLLVPDAAFLCGRLTGTMPPAVTLATGCDALAHLLEGWLNVGQDAHAPEVNEFAAIGVALVVAALPKVLADPADATARKAMQMAATLGGMTIRKKSTGLPHLASFSWFGRIAHGVAVARLLPAAWRYYIGSDAVARRTLEIGRVLGGRTPEAVIAEYERFLNLCGVPRLADYPELDVALRVRTAKSAGANRMKLELAPRPVPLERSEAVLLEILNDAFRA